MKANVIIRMGAPYWDARVRAADGKFVTFDLKRMEKTERRVFIRELTKAFRESRQ